MSVDDYWAEAKRIIAKSIENAVKHVAAGLEEVEADDDNIKVADYWPLGNQADEHTGLSAIETFIKARVRVLFIVSIYPPIAYRSGREEVNGSTLSSTWAKQMTNYILRLDGAFQQDVSQYPERLHQYTLHYGHTIRYYHVKRRQ